MSSEAAYSVSRMAQALLTEISENYEEIEKETLYLALRNEAAKGFLAASSDRVLLSCGGDPLDDDNVELYIARPLRVLFSLWEPSDIKKVVVEVDTYCDLAEDVPTAVGADLFQLSPQAVREFGESYETGLKFQITDGELVTTIDVVPIEVHARHVHCDYRFVVGGEVSSADRLANVVKDLLCRVNRGAADRAQPSNR